MARFHVSQDETGYFQLTYEDDAGDLTLVSYQFATPEQLIEDAAELALSPEYAGATVVVDPARRRVAESAGPTRPAPRKAGA